MDALKVFEQELTKDEQDLVNSLTTPYRIQAYLDQVPYSAESIDRCPLEVLRDRKAHCLDGALFAAMALRRIGYPPLILELVPNDRDDDHLLALYRLKDGWGAVAQSNFVGLRFREPVYRTLHELVMSYFEVYFNSKGEKTLRGYKGPLKLKAFDRFNWMGSSAHLDRIVRHMDRLRMISLLSTEAVSNLSPADERSFRAGMLGTNEAGLFKLE